jgi:hypothetical protein
MSKDRATERPLSETEEQTLFCLLKEGVTAMEAATRLGRTPHAVGSLERPRISPFAAKRKSASPLRADFDHAHAIAPWAQRRG